LAAGSAQAAGDRGIAQAGTDAAVAPAHPRRVLAVCILASSLAFIDGSVVNVGLPAIGRDLAVDGGGLAWVVNAYLLPLSALLLVGGAAGDLYGRRRLLILGVAVFAASSLLCAAAPGPAWLIAGRFAQGIGAAMLMPNSLAILGATFTGEARGRAVGTWAAVGAGAGALGPLIGGWLIDTVGWRTIFLVNLPIAAAAILLALRALPPDRPARQHGLDAAGAGLAACGLGSLTWGLTASSAAGSWGGAPLLAMVAGLALLSGFLLAERHLGEAAMMPLTLFASASFAGLTLLTLLLYGALGGLLVLLPYVLIQSAGYSALSAGAALVPLPAVIALTSARMGRLAGRIGPRLPLTLGPIVAAAGFLLAMRAAEPGPYGLRVLPAMLVIALGMAGAVAPLTTAVLASVAPGQTGVASGLNSAVARTGGLIVTALASVVLASRGAALPPAFRLACVVAAGLALAAGLCAFALVGRRRGGLAT
jgi:EmrB/QacA subfamily drug resistance transporter